MRFEMIEEVDEDTTVEDVAIEASSTSSDGGTTYNMDSTTIEYTSIETYLNLLNRNQEHGAITDNEVNLIDKALLCYADDKGLAKELINVYLATIINSTRKTSRRRSFDDGGNL